MSSRSVSSELLPLFEFSKIVNASYDLKFILATVLRTLMGKMLASQGAILARSEGKAFRFQLIKGIEGVDESHSIIIPWKGSSAIRLTIPSAAVWRQELSRLGLHILVPAYSRKELVGFIGLGPRLNGSSYTKADISLIQSLMDLSGSAIEKALIIDQVHDANRKLDRKVQELNTLFDLSKEFNTGLDFGKIVRLITFALMGQVGVREYAVCFRRGEAMDVLASRGASEAAVAPAVPQLCDLKAPSELSKLTKERSYRSSAAELLRLGFEAVVPMHSQGKTAGLILVGKKLQKSNYTAEDLEFLYALGNLAVISIENARLFQDAIEKQKMEDELVIAREIQQGLLPATLPEVKQLDIAALNVPSRQVGGDYYDVLVRSEHELVIAIGDVSGKGTPAALLMANIQAALRALAPSNESLSTITGRINDIASSNTRGGNKFITFFWGVFDHNTRVLRYVNAGHNPPLLLRKAGLVEKLDLGGLILGVFTTSAPYEEGSVILEPGDVLFMYTDGISESMSSDGRDFTEEKMLEIVQQSRRTSSQQIIDDVVSAVQVHAKGTEQSDDMTLLVLRAL